MESQITIGSGETEEVAEAGSRDVDVGEGEDVDEADGVKGGEGEEGGLHLVEVHPAEAVDAEDVVHSIHERQHPLDGQVAALLRQQPPQALCAVHHHRHVTVAQHWRFPRIGRPTRT